MLLSIIIPVYNCAPVVCRCLDSIDYHDAEIIVVDDGSKDDSAMQVMKYASSHPNVSLIRKENGGVSSARNQGIEAAHGEYLMFIDADDFLAPDGLNKVVELAVSTRADVVKYKIVSITSHEQNEADSLGDYAMSVQVIQGKGTALHRDDISDYHVVDALFRRSLIIENDLRFHTDLKLREDDVFMGEFYCHASTVVVTDLPLYQYVRSSPHSSTHRQSIERQRSLIQSAYRAIDYRYNYVKNYYPDALPLERLKYMRWVCAPKTAIRAGYSLDEYKQVLQKFKEYDCWPLDYRWIRVAGFDHSFRSKLKHTVKTFLCNHPGLAYLVFRG